MLTDDSDLSEIDIKPALLILPLDACDTEGLELFSRLDPDRTKKGYPRIVAVLDGKPNEGVKQLLQAYGAHLFEQDKGTEALIRDIDRLVTRLPTVD